MTLRVPEKFFVFWESAKEIIESRTFKVGALNLIAFIFAGVSYHYYMKHMYIYEYNSCYAESAPVKLEKEVDEYVRIACAILSNRESPQRDRNFSFCILRDSDQLPLLNKKTLDLYLKPCYQAVVNEVEK